VAQSAAEQGVKVVQFVDDEFQNVSEITVATIEKTGWWLLFGFAWKRSIWGRVPYHGEASRNRFNLQQARDLWLSNGKEDRVAD
jgi:hypothetical protein